MAPPRDKQIILADRLQVVLALTDANAAEARAQARLSGAQITSLSAETETQDPDRDGGTRSAQTQLEDAQSSLENIRQRISELQAHIEILDLELENTDK